eukprot:6475419-Amphidinium_carterae.1
MGSQGASGGGGALLLRTKGQAALRPPKRPLRSQEAPFNPFHVEEIGNRRRGGFLYQWRTRPFRPLPLDPPRCKGGRPEVSPEAHIQAELVLPTTLEEPEASRTERLTRSFRNVSFVLSQKI